MARGRSAKAAGRRGLASGVSSAAVSPSLPRLTEVPVGADPAVGADRLSRQRQDDASVPGPGRCRICATPPSSSASSAPSRSTICCWRRRPMTWSSCPTAAPAAPCARAWPMPSTGCCGRGRTVGQAAVPAHRAGDQRPGRSRTGSLHAVGRRLSRSVAPARSRRDDGRRHRRPGDARSLSRGGGAGGRRRPAAAHQDRSRRPPPTTLVAAAGVLNPTAPIVDARDAEAGDLLFGGSPKALPRPRPSAIGDACPRHLRACRCACSRPMNRLGFAMALGGLARDHGEKLLRVKGLVEFADRAGRAGGDPCRAAHAVSAALARALARCRRAPAGWSSSSAISNRTRSCAASPRASRRASTSPAGVT